MGEGGRKMMEGGKENDGEWSDKHKGSFCDEGVLRK